MVSIAFRFIRLTGHHDKFDNRLISHDFLDSGFHRNDGGEVFLLSSVWSQLDQEEVQQKYIRARQPIKSGALPVILSLILLGFRR